jgi:hypothetical protein
MEQVKQCHKCKEEKIYDNFYKSKNGKFGLSAYCKLCDNLYHKEYRKIHKKVLNQRSFQFRKDNPRAMKESNLRRYNLSLHEFDQLKEMQENKCAICGDLFTEKRLPNVDHCHNLNTVRGLLCNWCNRALGLFRDNPKLCRIGADYLEIYQNLALTIETGNDTFNTERLTNEP